MSAWASMSIVLCSIGAVLSVASIVLGQCRRQEKEDWDRAAGAVCYPYQVLDEERSHRIVKCADSPEEWREVE